MRIDAAVFVLLLLFMSATRVFAVDFFAARDRDQPLEIISQQLEVLQGQQKSIFIGAVVAAQGDMTLYTDVLTLFFDDQNDVRRIEAEGAVRIVDPLRTASADRVVFDRDEDTLIFSGHAEITQGENRISGDEIILYIGQNRSLVRSKDSGRVRAVILPETKSETP